MSKCNWVAGDACCNYWIAGDCNQLDSFVCEHKALTPAEKVPLTCPKCFDAKLIQHSLGYWYCPVGECTWRQPDSAQRPKMPAKPAIELLGDTEFGRAEMHDKLNEVIAWVAALEGK